MSSYMVVGDTKEYKGVLVTVLLNSKTQAEADAYLENKLADPDEAFAEYMKDYKNLRIGYEEHPWWEDPFLLD